MKQQPVKTRLSVVDYTKPNIPILTEPTASANTYIPYGSDNKFPEELKTFKRDSTTLGTIVNGVIDYIMGDGVDVLPAAGRFADTVNERGENMCDIVRQLAYDYVVFGGFAVHVIYSRNRTIAELYALDFSKVRSNKYNTILFYREDWNAGSELLQYPAFNRDTAAVEGTPSQIYYFKNGARTTYPRPMYESALKDIRIEIGCTEYNLSSISRGFMARYLFNIPDDQNLTDQQKEAFEKGIQEKFCGSNLYTNFMLYWAGRDGMLEVDKIESDDTNERYTTTREDARQSIYTAFRATPNLFGLPSATTGFNAQEYAQAFKLFQKTVISPMQKAIERAFAKIFSGDAIHIKPFAINFNEDNGNI